MPEKKIWKQKLQGIATKIPKIREKTQFRKPVYKSINEIQEKTIKRKKKGSNA